ncbi:MAG: hypothetical protein HY938_10340 [Nitrosomonadales bacterium]|nr:hypothetical protein [Nitrosomonadales bacterium]
MSKKIQTPENSTPADFSWARDSGFAPPKHAAGTSSDKTLAQASDLQPLLEELLETLLVAVDASAGMIRVIPRHGHVLQSISAIGLPPELQEAGHSPDIPCKRPWNTAPGRGIYAGDICSCDATPDCPYAGYPFQSVISVSIENEHAPEDTAGMLTLFFNRPSPADDRLSRTVLSFARLIGSVVEHNKSSRDAKRADLLAERQAIANEIHDSLAQTLVYTRMRTSLLLESIRTRNERMSAKCAHDIDEALEIGQKTVRELITDFRCAMDPAGLFHALQNLTDQFCQRNEIALEYINRVAHLELPLEYEIQIFHIAQEALANIATHSGASHARLIVDFYDDHYIFTIKDNGSGGCTFTPVEGHYGMMIMRERAQRIGGEINVKSSKGFGTHVQLSFPRPGADWRKNNE